MCSSLALVLHAWYSVVNAASVETSAVHTWSRVEASAVHTWSMVENDAVLVGGGGEPPREFWYDLVVVVFVFVFVVGIDG